jgi:hypothetical protein
MREELGQAQARIETLLEMGDGDEGRSEEGSEEASMAFDKVCRIRPIGRLLLSAVGLDLLSAGGTFWSPRYRNEPSGI